MKQAFAFGIAHLFRINPFRITPASVQRKNAAGLLSFKEAIAGGRET